MTVERLKPHPIEITFFSKRSNKATKLINSDDGFSVDGAHRWYAYDLVSPVYLTELRIEASGYDSWHKFEVEIDHIDGTKHIESVSVDSNAVTLSLRKLANGFKFRPESRWVFKTEILSVVASGYTLEEFHSLEWSVKQLDIKENRTAERERVFAEKELAESELDESISELLKQNGQLTAQKDELVQSNASLDAQVLDKGAIQKDVEREIETLQKQRREVKAEIAEDEKFHSNLTKKLRLFPSEISGFVEQGNRNIRSYLIIGTPFAAVFFVILWSLFSSSIDLTQLWRNEVDVDIWTIFLTRIPFVLDAVALIEACGFIVGRLIFEIVKINRQRLEFSKLSIVAKDVVTASVVDSSMTDEERFGEETKLKMQLLQEHMKSRSSEEFKYTGSAITSAVIGVANRFSGNK